MDNLQVAAAKLFDKFNGTYFEGKLRDTKLELSGKMKNTAGVFISNKNTIRINKNLLSLKGERELTEVLLHEMIHAFMHVTHSTPIRPHGVEFKDKMRELNRALGINISVRHDLHTWFRCNGKCSKIPHHFYGYLTVIDEAIFKSNHKNLQLHEKYCGGTFVKCSKPDDKLIRQFKRLRKERKLMEKRAVIVKDEKYLCRHLHAKRIVYSTDEEE